jgi:hypothetical protein
MKIILSKKENLIFEQLMVDITEKTIKPIPKLLEVETTDTGYTVIDINEKYTLEMYKEYHRWLPAIISQLKALYSLLETAVSSIQSKERHILKDIIG